MKIKVLPRCELVDLVKDDRIDEPCIVIAIWGTDEKDVFSFSRANDKITDELALSFDDVEGYCTGCTPIDEVQAYKIVDFVKKNMNKVDLIYISCAGGYSRSPAIAAALSLWFNGSDEEYFDGRKYCPNMLVYRTILNVLDGRDIRLARGKAIL